MASVVNVPPITIEQYLAFEPPEGYRDELLYGRIVLSPDPKPLHFDIAENVHKLLQAALGRKYRVGQRVNLRFPAENSMPSPDVFVIHQEEWNRAAAANEYPNGREAVLAVEILSPGNRSKDMRRKAGLYSANAIEIWLIDPKRQEVKVYREGSLLTFSAETATEIPLPVKLSGKAISLAGIFRLPY